MVNLAAFARMLFTTCFFVFVSSISTTMNPPAPSKKVPETIIPDIYALPAVGYTESKYLTERLRSRSDEALPPKPRYPAHRVNT